MFVVDHVYFKNLLECHGSTDMEISHMLVPLTEVKPCWLGLQLEWVTENKSLMYQIIVRFTNSMVYYGVLLSVGVLGGSLYLNFFLTSAIDIPSNFFVIWFMSWEKRMFCKSFYGRKRALILCMNLAAVFCITVSLIPPQSGPGTTAARVIFTVLGKFCINASFSTIYVFSTELLPTVIRNVGMGSMAAFDQIGASIAPFVVLLDKTHPVIPFAVMSGFACFSGCLCGLLPETLGRRTLETLEDMSDSSPHNKLDNSDQSEEHLTSSV